MIEVKLVSSEEMKIQAHYIREKVFVEEQKVSREEEYDEFENDSRHFLAYILNDEEACGTARWRFTKHGIKLERFAVLPAFRSKRVGSALLKNVLEDIQQNDISVGKKIYLHAQIQAIGLYKKFGFKVEGDMFQEAGIQHYLMVK